MGKGKTYLVLGSILMALVFSGCGDLEKEKGGPVNFDDPTLIKAENPQVGEFDRQLGEIKDLPTAEKAVNSFLDYADSRIKKPAGALRAQSLRALMTDDLVKKVALREIYARGISLPQGLSGSDEAEPAKPLIDIGTITDSVNQLGSTEGVRVRDEDVIGVKTATEASLPNLNPVKSDQMTPLNAMVVGYALGAGDDGTAPQNSVNLPIDKAVSFVGTVTQ